MKYIKFFDQIDIEDIDEVGGKNASLGEMYQNLSCRQEQRDVANIYSVQIF